MEFIIVGKSIISGGREAMVAGTGSWLVILIHTQLAERQEVWLALKPHTLLPGNGTS